MEIIADEKIYAIMPHYANIRILFKEKSYNTVLLFHQFVHLKFFVCHDVPTLY